jgi:hypothetical protein
MTTQLTNRRDGLEPLSVATRWLNLPWPAGLRNNGGEFRTVHIPVRGRCSRTLVPCHDLGALDILNRGERYRKSYSLQAWPEFGPQDAQPGGQNHDPNLATESLDRHGLGGGVWETQVASHTGTPAIRLASRK